ncbi:MAG: adenosylcobinamide-GDP ribazoletransferase [Clostridia bacterium]|nr:adenosylcobinamide-GDP ribazoletransferase [Clostridia bacterium]
MGCFLSAVSFLTIIPVGREDGKITKYFSGVLCFFPLVGLFLGSLLAALSFGMEGLGLGGAGDAVTVIALVILTGGLHMDGLMDTADGVFSGKSRYKKLEIMRDSRVGAMGIMAFISIMLLKIYFLGEIPFTAKWKYLILMPAAGRWAMVFAIHGYPYARSEGGLGKGFTNAAGKKVMVGTSLVFIMAAVIILGGHAFYFLPWVILLTLLVSKFIAKSLGGLTGDCYGAVCEIVETFVLFFGAVSEF